MCSAMHQPVTAQVAQTPWFLPEQVGKIVPKGQRLPRFRFHSPALRGNAQKPWQTTSP